MTGSSINSMRSRINSSCLLRTLIVLFLQQLSLHAMPMFGPLEELEDALEGSEDDWYIWWISWSLELLEDSLSEWSSSKSLKISFLLVWSLTKELIRAFAFCLHSVLKWPLFPQLKHFPDALEIGLPVDLDFPFL